jgi:hypothetical protein
MRQATELEKKVLTLTEQLQTRDTEINSLHTTMSSTKVEFFSVGALEEHPFIVRSCYHFYRY